MATTTTTSKKIPESLGGFTDGFGDVAERYRTLNEKLIESGKKTSKAAVEGYQKSVASYVDFRQQLAEATQLDWVSTVVKAQNDFITEVTAAYTLRCSGRPGSKYAQAVKTQQSADDQLGLGEIIRRQRGWPSCPCVKLRRWRHLQPLLSDRTWAARPVGRGPSGNRRVTQRFCRPAPRR